MKHKINLTVQNSQTIKWYVSWTRVKYSVQSRYHNYMQTCENSIHGHGQTSMFTYFFSNFLEQKFQDFLNSLSKKLQDAKQQIMHPMQYYIRYKMWQVNWHGKRLNVHNQISGILCHKKPLKSLMQHLVDLFPKRKDCIILPQYSALTCYYIVDFPEL